MKTLLTRSKYVFAVFMASFIALSGLLALVPQTTFAAPPAEGLEGTFYDLPSAHEQAVVWTSYVQATHPDGCYVANYRTADEIRDGKWLAESTEKFGHHVDPDDASLDCDNENDWFSNLLSAAGITASEYETEAQKVFNYANGSYGQKPDSDRILVNVLAADLFGGTVPSGTYGQVTYAILFENFVHANGCNASTANTSNPVEIWEFKEGDPSTVEQVTYGYDDDNVDKGIGVGYGTGVYVSNFVECATIANTLSSNKSFAEDMLSWSNATGNGLGDTSDGTVGSDPELDCGAAWSSVSWYLCPMIKLVNGFISGLDNAINAMLTVDQVEIFDRSTDTGAAYYSAWQAFRNIALGLLFIAALTMLIAQAFGWEILDAYTVKKILPRVLVSIIGISLSWDIMNFFVGLTNDLGLGIRQLIYYPFKDINEGLTLGGGAFALLGLLTSGAVIGLTLFGLLSFAVTAMLGLIIAFMVLVIRQLVIVVLILFSPIAIACYILPNTQGVWKLWYESFTKAMMMFPIIVAFLAVGRVFALTATSGGVGVDVPAINQLIGLAAYIMPYFLIPLTFRFAGGALRTIGGFTNDQGRGSFDRLKKYRQGKSAQSNVAMKGGTRFNNRPMNALTARATSKRLGFTEQGRQAYSQKMDLAAAEHAKSAGGQALQHNDDALRAGTYGSASEARDNMKADFRKSDGSSYTDAEVDTSIAAVKASGGFGRARQVYAAQQLSATGTGYNDGDIEQVAKTIARVSHGNESTIASIAGNINSGTKSVGRHDLAPGFKSLNTLARQEAGIEGGPKEYGAAHESAWDSGSLYQHANDKKANIEAAIGHYTPLLAGNDDQRQKAGVFFNELRSMQPNASGDVKNKIQEALTANHTAIEALYDSKSPTALPHTPGGINATPTGRQQVQVRDPVTGDLTLTVTPPTGYAPESARNRVERLSRTYERPDPNNM